MSIFLYSHWLKLPISTRNEIARIFGIARTKPTHVADNVVVEDGYNIHDVENALSDAALRKYLESEEEDFSTLWENTVAKAEGRDYGIKAKVNVEDWKDSVGSTGNAAPIIPPHAPEALKEPTTEKAVTHETPKKRGRKPRA